MNRNTGTNRSKRENNRRKTYIITEAPEKSYISRKKNTAYGSAGSVETE